MLKDHQISKMIMLQDKINSVVNIDWIVANNNWMLAGAMELAEAIDHHGWKWWKHSEKNLPLLQNELIDYWHFVLSKSIIDSHGDVEGALNFVSPKLFGVDDIISFDGKSHDLHGMNLVEKLFLMIGLSASGRFEFYLFQSIMKDCELTWEELFKQYVSKNVLNVFRQVNGYKTGAYSKIWYDGREDNLHMLELLDYYSSIFDEPEFVDVLEMELRSRYARTIANK